MSASRIARSPDLARLTEEGHDLALLNGLLLVRGLPYLGRTMEVHEGTLVVPLRLQGDDTIAPTTHLVSWIGQTPYGVDGAPLHSVMQSRHGTHRAPQVEPTHTFCIKPPGREFRDYHELVITYAQALGSHAEAVSPGITARFGPRANSDGTAVPTRIGPTPWTGARRRSPTDGPFLYADTASARAGLGAVNARLRGTVGIVGLGGTGAHVLDLVAKTDAGTIHLFDADVFEQHSAFRCPGASSIADVSAGRPKVRLLADRYAAMRNGVVPHAVRIEAANAYLLDELDFCFVCIDDGVAKGPILDRLALRSIPWIDVGIGLALTGAGVVGAVRTTVGTPGGYDDARSRIPSSPPMEDGYATNIQTCDLNALNAALAVVEWKRTRGFYASDRRLLNSVLIVGNGLLHEEERG